MPRPLLLGLALLLAIGGCSLGDCTFETSESRTVGGVVVADGRSVGDTLTIAFLSTDASPLEVRTDAGIGTAPDRTPDGAIEVLYDAVARSGPGGRLPQPLVSTVRGDTAFVYVFGTVDPVSLACSPPVFGVEIAVRDLLVPEGVVAVEVTRLDLGDVPEATAAALRQSAAARRAARPITA